MFFWLDFKVIMCFFCQRNLQNFLYYVRSKVPPISTPGTHRSLQIEI
ncbi:hypothetical protein F383_33185 [Gossypium arboreum]|uniref:Uncharacterized protein n=1 Tax=Gossypium arboreum TaxID=29729 RepID=A0A0B0N7G7_GOSAR|nr:hypothetical protein F383_33185 [Gossypium arboreum]